MNLYQIGDFLRVTRPGAYFGVEFTVDYIDKPGKKVRYSNIYQLDANCFDEDEVELLFGSECPDEEYECPMDELQEENELLRDTLFYLIMEHIQTQAKLIEYLEE